MLDEPPGVSVDTNDDLRTTSVREQRRQPRNAAVSIAHRLRRLTEGFYDTAVTEAVEFESREIVPMPAPVAYQRRCAEGLA
ncbi:hypothetical protein CEE69_30495 [Rhodopirellula bahusiensis]|uniref:Uncharacterized protein n=1 Tax=Rhodopirellula bahusiensis TaxID=2014065 RepID=A0A2G1VY46_9BACT|nr:hypothetical protein CEE69_30495 [Rhodopirellula bahusiensis]